MIYREILSQDEADTLRDVVINPVCYTKIPFFKKLSKYF